MTALHTNTNTTCVIMVPPEYRSGSRRTPPSLCRNIKHSARAKASYITVLHILLLLFMQGIFSTTLVPHSKLEHKIMDTATMLSLQRQLHPPVVAPGSKFPAVYAGEHPEGEESASWTHRGLISAPRSSHTGHQSCGHHVNLQQLSAPMLISIAISTRYHEDLCEGTTIIAQHQVHDNHCCTTTTRYYDFIGAGPRPVVCSDQEFHLVVSCFPHDLVTYTDCDDETQGI